jgi:hypothetical protein
MGVLFSSKGSVLRINDQPQAAPILMPPIRKLAKWEIFYSFLIILPMAAAMTIGDYILRRRATGNDG